MEFPPMKSVSLRPLHLVAGALIALLALTWPAILSAEEAASQPTSQPAKQTPCCAKADKSECEKPQTEDCDETKKSEGESACCSVKAKDESTSPAVKLAQEERPSTGTLRIIVKWGVETSVDNFGFNVYRTDDPDKPHEEWEKLNKRIMSGIGTTSVPHVFRYLDDNLGHDPEKVWFYKFEEIGLDGTRVFHAHPVTGERPLIVGGKPKVILESERTKFAGGPFQIEKIER